jgi:hypothetical protein
LLLLVLWVLHLRLVDILDVLVLCLVLHLLNLSLFLVTLVVDAIVEVGIIINLVLLVNVSYPWPILYDSAALKHFEDAVRELRRQIPPLVLKITLGRVERGQDYRFGLAILQDRVLGRVQHVLCKHILVKLRVVEVRQIPRVRPHAIWLAEAILIPVEP